MKPRQAAILRSDSKEVEFGSEEEQFSRLPALFDSLREADPSGEYVLDTVPVSISDPERRFSRCFCAWGAAKSFVEATSDPVVVLDGTFLPTKFPQTLLLGTILDSGRKRMILSCAVVQSETEDSRNWFVENMQSFFAFDLPSLVVVSDRDKGLVNSVATYLPGAFHAYCALHLRRNAIATAGMTGIRPHFMRAVKARSEAEFLVHMEALRKGNEKAYSYLMDIDHCTWATYAFPKPIGFGTVTSNTVEQANALFLPIRKRWIIHLLNGIRDWTAEHMRERHLTTVETNQPAVPYALGRLTETVAAAKKLKVSLFGVASGRVSADAVDLDKRVCTCGMFAEYDFPCVHAVALALAVNVAPSSLVGHRYLVDRWRAQYATCMTAHNLRLPMSGLLTPITRRPCGRPRRKRVRSNGELLTAVAPAPRSCTRCGWSGHNARTCTEPLVPMSQPTGTQ